MTDPVDSLVLDLIEWIGPRPRPYAEVIEAWRTSCPRLPVWETANERGFVEQVHAPGAPALVRVSPAGLSHLRAQRASAARAVAARADGSARGADGGRSP